MKLLRPTAAVLAALLFTESAFADPQPTYVFVQGHSGSTQAITAGSRVQVQLPVGPKTWSLDGDSRNISVVQSSLYPSQGRIPDSNGVQVFDLEIRRKNRPAYIVFTSFGPPSALPGYVGQGRFELMLETGKE